MNVVTDRLSKASARKSSVTAFVERLALNKSFRHALIPLFRRFNLGDIRIRHHHTSHTLTLHSFKHRGYWFHGDRREARTIERFRTLIKPGDTVIDVGGHIGYFTLLFSELAGPAGRVLVFEPSPNNLRYLHNNVDHVPNVTVKEIALCDREGTAELFVEDLSGQNCTLVPAYSVYRSNVSASGLALDVTGIRVPCATLDRVLMSEPSVSPPRVIKIDAEGGELEILSGMSKTLSLPNLVLMIEVSRRQEEVSALLRRLGFDAFGPDGERLEVSLLGCSNVFFARGRPL